MGALHHILYTTQVGWEMHHMYRLIPFLYNLRTLKEEFQASLYLCNGKVNITVSLSQNFVNEQYSV